MKKTLLIRLVLAGVLLLAGSLVMAGQVTHTMYFDPPTFQAVDGQMVPVFSQGYLISNPGEPLVPRIGVTLLLPPGEEMVSVRVSTFNRQVLPGRYHLPPAQKQYPLSDLKNHPATPENPDIYQNNTFYPASRVTDRQTYFLSGHGLGFLTICPLEYNPVTGEIAYYRQIEVTAITNSTPRARQAQSLYRSTEKVRARVAQKVVNPENLAQYAVEQTDLENVYQILLITANNWIEDFQPWIDFKNACGMPVYVETIENILATYPGVDDAEKIRNCIIHDYQQWATLEYVVLGGDGDGNSPVLQHRGLSYQGSTTDNDIAADLYFVALDGNWDNNGNHIYGEPGEYDLVAELAVGRMCVDSRTEIANAINKSMMYSRQPVDADIEKGLMVGEDLGWTVWGSAYKDEIRNGSSNWGYTTVGFPANFDTRTLYDTPSFTWSALTHLLPMFNNGVNLVNHLGHANVTYGLKFNSGDVNDNNMTNNGTNHGFYLIFTQGCYCGSFDNRTENNTYTSDCIGESFTTIHNSAFAYIGNSRYGWGSTNNTNGASQYFDRQFFDAIFGENIYKLGWVLNDSKEDVIPWINVEIMRWCYYEVNILGDPTIDLWTATPVDMQPELPDEIIVDQEAVEVNVPGVEGALIGISHQGELIGIGTTDATGHATVTLDPPPQMLDPLTFVITAHNYHYFTDSVEVIAPQGAWILLDGYTLHDDTGNNNGLLDWGETISLDVTFQNVGLLDATGVSAEMTGDIRQVSIIDGSATVGSIAAGTSSEVENAFSFRVNPMIEDQQTVTLTLTIHDAQDSTWTRYINLTSHAPNLDVEFIDLNGTGYGHLPVGQASTLQFTIHNQGTSATPAGQLTVTTDTPMITMTGNSASLGVLAPDSSGTPSSTYTINVSSSCPEPASVMLYLTLSDPATQYVGHMMTRMYVGGIFNNVEAGEGTWTHAGTNDQWHISTQRNHSPNGQQSWKCGDTGGGNYSSGEDATLTTDEFNLAENSMLTFWHWMQAELSQSYPGQCYDGGIVEITTNGGQSWVPITPSSGYPYITRGSGPFGTGVSVFSGIHDWEQVYFDLSAYSGTVQIRFHFGSDGAVEMEGWYVDDIEIRPNEMPEAPENLTASITLGRVNLNWSYAGGGLDEQGELCFNVYRNEVKIDSMVNFHAYIDVLDGLPSGDYSYYITAQIDTVESAPSNTATVIYNGESVTEQDNGLIPSDYVLNQNYPNPFNPMTTIRYGLPERNHVALKVYNILGQNVATLVDEVKPAGYYIVHWNAGHLASGLYFTRMESGNRVRMTKMLLLK
jgi:hypothetical protein